jgi:hypothetical protein
MKHLWVFCFAADGFQTWVSQGFSRMHDMGKLHLSSWITVVLCPQVSWPRCSCRSLDLAWWGPHTPCPSHVLSLITPSAQLAGGLDLTAPREGVELGKAIYRDGDTYYNPSLKS